MSPHTGHFLLGLVRALRTGQARNAGPAAAGSAAPEFAGGLRRHYGDDFGKAPTFDHILEVLTQINTAINT